MKKDAIPGFINEIWVEVKEPGVYRGQCAELCGKDHGFMPIVVEAKPEAEFKQWLAEARVEHPTRVAGGAAPSQATSAPERETPADSAALADGSDDATRQSAGDARTL